MSDRSLRPLGRKLCAPLRRLCTGCPAPACPYFLRLQPCSAACHVPDLYLCSDATCGGTPIAPGQVVLPALMGRCYAVMDGKYVDCGGAEPNLPPGTSCLPDGAVIYTGAITCTTGCGDPKCPPCDVYVMLKRCPEPACNAPNAPPGTGMVLIKIEDLQALLLAGVRCPVWFAPWGGCHVPSDEFVVAPLPPNVIVVTTMDDGGCCACCPGCSRTAVLTARGGFNDCTGTSFQELTGTAYLCCGPGATGTATVVHDFTQVDGFPSTYTYREIGAMTVTAPGTVTWNYKESIDNGSGEEVLFQNSGTLPINSVDCFPGSPMQKALAAMFNASVEAAYVATKLPSGGVPGSSQIGHRVFEEVTTKTTLTRKWTYCNPPGSSVQSGTVVVVSTVSPGPGPCNDDCVDNGPGRPAGAPCSGCGGKVTAGELLR